MGALALKADIGAGKRIQTKEFNNNTPNAF